MTWAELLAARGVFAKRSWPPGCGRFPGSPDAGEISERGVVEGRHEEAAADAVVSPAAYNGSVPRAPPRPQPEGVVVEGDGGVCSSDGQREESTIDALPLAFTVRQSCADIDSSDNGGDGANLLPLKGKEDQGSGQLVRDVVITGDGDAIATRNRAGDGESEREEDGGRKKRWLMSLVNSPPKRRTVSAVHRFPPGCGRDAVNGTGSINKEGLVVEDTPISFTSEGASVVDPILGCGASPVFMQGASNEEMEAKMVDVEGATMACSRMQESQFVNHVVPHDCCHDSACRRDVVTKDSPRHSLSEKMNGKRPLHQGKHATQVMRDNQMKIKCEESSQEPLETPVGGLIDVNTNGKRSESATQVVDVEGATMARSRIQESQFVNHVVPHDFAGDCHDSTCRRDVVTKDSPRHSLSEKMNGKRPLHQGKHATQVVRDNQMKIKCEGSSREGTLETPVGGLIDVNTNGKRSESAKMNETLLDNVDVFEEGITRNKNMCTHRGVESSNINVKQDMFSCKLKPGEKGHNSLSRLARESKSENQIIVQALIAPDKFPLTQGRKSIASLSCSLTPQNKLKKKDATYKKEMHPKVMVNLSTSTRNEAIEDKEDSSLEDDENSLALVKKVMFACKLKAGGKGHARDSKSKNSNLDLYTTRIIVQALMAPDNFSLTQEKKSIASVSWSLTPRYKLPKKDATSGKEFPLRKATTNSDVCEDLCLPDISEGKESIPIRVVNAIDDMQPMPFKYITKITYPPSYAREPPKGCDCTEHCSDSSTCACAVKNGGEIPFNFSSEIVEEKSLIYECGPSCSCPPTCHNRVSQHGVKIPLEIFKTEKRGWGVRSLTYISSGSFVCEYVGELLEEAEAEKAETDEYLFDIGRNYDDEESETMEDDVASDDTGYDDVASDDTGSDDVGYTIDSAKCGNVGRFINHSCSPNLYPQNVLWDHDDKTMPHVMLFAYENILPLQELMYDYHYHIGKVRDKNGQEKVKPCCCGSSKCRRRLY